MPKSTNQRLVHYEVTTSGVEPLLSQIAGLEAEIIRVTNQLQSSEKDQIRAGQAIIGVSSDGAFGGNTRRALVAWVAAQRDRITQIQGEVAHSTQRRNIYCRQRTLHVLQALLKTFAQYKYLHSKIVSLQCLLRLTRCAKQNLLLLLQQEMKYNDYVQVQKHK